MKLKNSLPRISILLLILIGTYLPNKTFAQKSNIIKFNDENWTFFGGEVVEHLGQISLSGTAELKSIEFEDGIIEFDLSVNGARSYPGIRFRAQSRANTENIYIRPHILGIGDNALQYAPIFNGEACWQLYHGEGFTSELLIPLNQWVHIKLKVSGSRARLYIGENRTPILKIEDLKHGISKGGIALVAPADGSAHFANFTIDRTTKIELEEPLDEEAPPGIITDWEISQPIKSGNIDLNKPYTQQGIKDLQWQKVSCENNGLVNISKHIQRRGTEPDFIFARTTISSENDELKQFNFGYSDMIVIFLNGKQIFTGSSPYQGRGTSFQGVIGFYDAVSLPLKKGANELQFIVGETFGGWGFMCQEADAIFMERGIEKVWESKKLFTTSESVLYDKKREVLYVTNFDQYNVNNPASFQHISKVSLSGDVIDLHWVDSLDNPLGMAIYKDRLFTAERKQVAEIDLETGKVIRRYPVPQALFLNDLAINDKGIIFVTDSRKNSIWRIEKGKVEEWLKGEEVLDPNVIYIKGNTLFFGNSGDQSLKSVSLIDKSIRTITRFETGFIDGFRIDESGNYLVSLWKGKVYRVTPEGKKTKILDTSVPGTFSADFEYIREKKMLILPNFFSNTVTAYKLH